MRILVVAVALLAVGVQCSVEELLQIDETDVRCATLDTACKDLWLASMCKKTKQCIPRWEQLPTEQVGNDTELCALCKQMVKEAEDTLLSNETLDELRQVLEGSCDILVPIPGIKQLCKKLMDEFMNELLDILISKMDPTQVCTVSGLCYDDNELLSRFGEFSARLQLSAEECTSCNSAVTKTKSFTKFLPQDAVVKAFVRVCEEEFGKGDAKCQRFGRTYVAKFYQRFNSASSGQTCQFLNKCPGAVAMVPKGVQDELECEFCEAMIHKLRAQFNNTSAKTEVKSALLNFCKVTGSYEQECVNEVNSNFDKAYDEILAMLDPKNVCTLIGLCGASSEMALPLTKLTPALQFEAVPLTKLTPARRHPSGIIRDTECELCKLVVNEIDSEITDNATVNEIKSLLDSICYDVPVVSNSVCVDFVNTNIAQFMKMITDRYTGDYVCTNLIGICPSAQKFKVAPVPVQTNEGGEICSICELVVTWVAEELNATSTENDIISLLDEVCDMSWFPDKDRTECRSMVESYGSLILHMLVDRMQPNEICKAIYLCAASKSAPRLSGETCELCEMAGDWLITTLKDNQTEEAILAALDSVCAMIPVDSNECKTYIKTYTDELIKLLTQDLTSQELCAALGLCPTAAVTKKVGDSCPTCMLLAGYIVSELKDNKTEADILSGLEEVCKVIPINAQECKGYVDKYGEELINALANDVSADEICKAIGLCSTRRVPIKTKKVGDGCSTCMLLAGFVVSELKDNKTEAEILSGLEEVCKVIPMNAQECKNYVDTYGGILINALANDVDAQEICSTLGLCSTRRPPVKPKKVGDGCSTCMLLAGFIVSELKDNKTEADILSGLEEVCKVIPMNAQECKNYVETYGGILINALANDVDAQEICSTLGLCSTRRVTAKAKKVGDECSTCMLFAGYIISELKDNKTEAEILAGLEEVCKIIPMDGNECKNIIDTYGSMIIDMLIKNVSADEICAEIGLCSSTRRSHKVKDDYCVLCQTVAGYLVDELKDNKTEEAIISALEKVCNVIPMDPAECQTYVDTYAEQLFEMLQKDLTVDQICSALGLCASRRAVKNSGDFCVECRVAAEWLVNAVQNNKTEAAILSALDEVCNVIPVDGVECRNYINTYAGMLIEMLSKDVTADEICDTLGLCSARRMVKRVRGVECGFCKEAVGWLVNELVNNKTEAAIEAAMEKVCYVIPMNKDDCKRYVDVYGSMIVQMLVEDMSADEICSVIGLCSTRKVVKKVGDKCSICETAAQWLIDQLKDNKTEAAIVAALDQVCDAIPIDQTECRSYVDQYAKELIELLSQDLDAEQICTSIGLCSVPRKVKTVCTTCTMVANFLITTLEDKATQADIVAALDKVCSMSPIDATECKEYVDEYAPSIINSLLDGVTPDELCDLLHLCPGGTKKIRDSA